jgi:hypothetical protein
MGRSFAGQTQYLERVSCWGLWRIAPIVRVLIQAARISLSRRGEGGGRLLTCLNVSVSVYSTYYFFTCSTFSTFLTVEVHTVDHVLRQQQPSEVAISTLLYIRRMEITPGILPPPVIASSIPRRT